MGLYEGVAATGALAAQFTVEANSADDDILTFKTAEYIHFGTTEVCAASEDVGGSEPRGCSGKVPWNEARAMCEAADARLCSVEELLHDEAHNSGCGYNSQLVWTISAATANSSWTDPVSDRVTELHSERCPNDYFVQTYGSYSDSAQLLGTPLKEQGECFEETTVAFVRCCADAYGCTDPPTPQPTPLPSSQPTPCLLYTSPSPRD